MRRERSGARQMRIRDWGNRGMGKGGKSERSIWSARYSDELSEFDERRGGGARMAEIGSVMRRVGKEIMGELMPWTEKRLERRKGCQGTR